MPERSIFGRLCALSWLMSALLVAQAHAASISDAPTITPSRLPHIGTVDERFQSYNIEMVEITGGRFWRPYRSQPDVPSAPSADTSRDKDANLFQ
jgi:heparanase